MSNTKKFLLGLLFFLALMISAFAGSVRLSWDASPTPNIARYRIYSAQPGLPFSVAATWPANVLSATVYNLEETKDYIFYVTAVDANGNESPPSGSVSYTVPLFAPSLTVVERFEDPNDPDFYTVRLRIGNGYTRIDNYELRGAINDQPFQVLALPDWDPRGGPAYVTLSARKGIRGSFHVRAMVGGTGSGFSETITVAYRIFDADEENY